MGKLTYHIKKSSNFQILFSYFLMKANVISAIMEITKFLNYEIKTISYSTKMFK